MQASHSEVAPSIKVCLVILATEKNTSCVTQDSLSSQAGCLPGWQTVTASEPFTLAVGVYNPYRLQASTHTLGFKVVYFQRKKGFLPSGPKTWDAYAVFVHMLRNICTDATSGAVHCMHCMQQVAAHTHTRPACTAR